MKKDKQSIFGAVCFFPIEVCLLNNANCVFIQSVHSFKSSLRHSLISIMDLIFYVCVSTRAKEHFKFLKSVRKSQSCGYFCSNLKRSPNLDFWKGIIVEIFDYIVLIQILLKALIVLKNDIIFLLVFSSVKGATFKINLEIAELWLFLFQLNGPKLWIKSHTVPNKSKRLLYSVQNVPKKSKLWCTQDKIWVGPNLT